jgi:hypothetical protein
LNLAGGAEKLLEGNFTYNVARLTPEMANTVLAWKDRYLGITTRLYYTMVTVAAAAFIWLLNYWNLLGWRF